MTPQPDSPLVLGLDSSTTGSKALITDMDGKVFALGKATYDILQPAPDHYEQDARDWGRAAFSAIADAVAQLESQDRRRLAACCITPQRQTFVLCDDDGTPRRNAILWLDGRASDEVRRIGSERVHQISGFEPDVTPSIYKIAWLAHHERERLCSAQRVVGVHSWLVHELTGQWVDSVATADSLGICDLARLEWSDELLELCGLRRQQLPDLAAAASVVGTMLPDVASSLGLAGPIPVVAGCGDGQAAALGAGVTEADEGYLNMGTAVVAGVHSSQYRWSQVYRTDVAGIPGSYVLEVVQNSGAHLAQWFRTALGDPALQGAPDPELEQAAAQVRPGADGLLTLPYWNAVQSPHWDPLARGAMVGFTGSHSRPAMYRSLLEGICLETGRNLAALDAETGTPMRKLRIMGGGQRSDLWCRIMAACVARPLERCVSEEISALGAAVMAASAVVERSVPEMSRQMAEPGDTIEPQQELVEEYASIADVQGELYHALSGVFPRLEALRQ